MADLTHVDLEPPKGVIDPAVFYPGTAGATVDAQLDQYLADGYAALDAAGVTGSDRDAGARAYAYWQAHLDVARRLAATPANATLGDQGSISYTTAQLAAWQQLAAAFEADYKAILASVAATGSPSADVPASGTTTLRATW